MDVVTGRIGALLQRTKGDDLAADPNALHTTQTTTWGTGMDCWQPPSIAHLVPRARLLGLIHSANPPGLLLCGPPGSGKSSLLATVYQQHCATGVAVAWLQLQPEHNQPEALHAALEQLGKHPAVLLLVDDLHLLEASAHQQFSRWWLGNPRRRIIAADRRLRGSLLHQARLHGQLQVIDADPLQLDELEARQLLGTAFSDADARVLNRRLAGWAAGLRLLALHPEQACQLLGPADIGWLLPPAITAWLDEVLIPSLGHIDLDALGILATINPFPAAMLNHLPDTSRLLQTIEQLGHASLLLLPPPARAGWIELHPVITSHLGERLRLQQPQCYAQSKRMAAHWFTHNGQPGQAVRHALQLPHKEEADALIERAGAITVDLGSAPDLPLTAALPPERAHDRPLLFLSQVYQHVRHGQPDLARDLFEQASALTAHYTDLAADADLAATRTWVTLLEAVFHSSADNPIPEILLQDMQGHFSLQRERQPILAACVASVLAYHHVDAQQYRQAISISQAGLQLQRQPEKISVFLRLHQGYAQLALHGPQLAADAIHRARTIADSESAPDSYEVLCCRLLQGVLLAEDNQADAALELLLPALEKIDQVYGWVCLYAESHAAAADALYRCQGLEAAQALLVRGHAFAELRQLPRLHHHLALCELQLLNRAGQWRQAQALLQGPWLAPLLQPGATGQAQLRGLQVPVLLEAAHLQLLLGQIHPAQDLLAQIPAEAPSTADCRQALFAQLLQMRIAQSSRRLGLARQCLQQALQLSADHALARRSHDAADWLQQAAQWAVNERWPLPDRLAAHLRQLGGTAQPGLLPRQSSPAPGMPHANTALSPRECQTMALLAEGLSSKEIARQLGISAGTVKTHRKKIYEKLAVSNRAQAITRARSLLIL